MSQTNIIRAIWQRYDVVPDDVYSPEITLGGVLVFEAFKFPELLKYALKPLLSIDEMLKQNLYPDPDNYNPSQASEYHLIHFDIPKDVFISNREDIRIGWWDAEEKKWKSSPEDIQAPAIDTSN